MRVIIYLILLGIIIFIGWSFKDILFGIGYH